MQNDTNTPNHSRRRFLQHSLIGTAGLGLGIASTSQVRAEPLPNAGDPEIDETYDVVVFGGGTAGIIAALQAGRAGASVLIVERGAQLGGTITTGGVSFPGLFDAWGQQVIAGIGWDLVKECVEIDGGNFPDFSRVPQRHWHNQIYLNPYLYAILAEEKCAEAGVKIAYHEFPLSAAASPDGGWAVTCVGFGTMRRIHCKQIIDCTGGAEVVGMLGFERMREEETQPGSMYYSLNSPMDAGRDNVSRLYVHGADSSNSRSVAHANITGRKAVLDLVRRHKARLMHLQQETGFRESYRIVGETIITVNDYRNGRKFDDAICNAFYPVDLHTRRGVRPEPLPRGTVSTVPFRALIPKNSRDLMVAGRSVSSDRLANSGLRVQAPCMAMGQAAGAAATLAVQKGTTPLEVPLNEIHALLREHNAIIPGDA